MTIGRITLGINPGQSHAHKLKRTKYGVSFDWYTVDPDVLLLPFLITLALWSRGVAWKIPRRLIPDPSSNVNIHGYPANEPDCQSGSGSAGGTSTVVNKRKYTASTDSTSSSLSSSTSSSEADRAESVPRERIVSPRRTQMAKRQRLAPSGGGGVSASSAWMKPSPWQGLTIQRKSSILQARQTFAPPPVFRRRPPTPFNHPPRETGVTGDQGEGSGYVEGGGDDEVEAGGSSPGSSFDLSSDDSLALRSPALR